MRLIFLVMFQDIQVWNYNMKTPFNESMIQSLSAGDFIYLSGFIYTARDAAHKLMHEALKKGDIPPFDYNGQVVFYAGPCPAPPGKPIGSVGPTTAGRMDLYAPDLIAAGLRIMVGKGERTDEVAHAIKEYNGLYLVAVGGVAALLARCVKSSEIVGYDFLETEAIRRLYVDKMPLIVAIDGNGRRM